MLEVIIPAAPLFVIALGFGALAYLVISSSITTLIGKAR